MHSNIVCGIFCVAVCATVCGGAPHSDEITEVATTPQFFSFKTVIRKYNKFVKSPEPFMNIISTRALLEENVQKVKPLGVVLQRCPISIPTMENWRCRSDKSVKVILKVMIYDGHRFKSHNIDTKEDISCICKPEY